MGTPIFTSEWEWVSINREQDVSVSNGNTLTRNNWSVTRKRVSNAPYVSEVGTEKSELTAYNGGVSETVRPPETEVVTFDTTTAWTKTTTLWIPSGLTNNNAPIYVSNESPNIPDPSKINILYVSYDAVDEEFTWYAYESVDGLPGPSINRCGSDDYTTIPSLDGLLFDNSFGSFTGSATSSITTAPIYDFYCSSDNQSYGQNGVDWFTQTQTWIFKDGYS